MTIVSHLFWNWYLFRTRSWVWRYAWAGVAPDVPYFILLGYYSVRFHVNGFTDLTAWDLAWRSPLVMALHSFVPWAVAVGILCAVAGPLTRRAWWPILGGWLSHIVIDMLTHRNDGYPIFYPLATYRFPTPISYWEPAFHGRMFSLVDSTLTAVLLVHHFVSRRRRAVRRPVVRAAR